MRTGVVRPCWSDPRRRYRTSAWNRYSSLGEADDIASPPIEIPSYPITVSGNGAFMLPGKYCARPVFAVEIETPLRDATLG
jgi:hypothetical protein